MGTIEVTMLGWTCKAIAVHSVAARRTDETVTFIASSFWAARVTVTFMTSMLRRTG